MLSMPPATITSADPARSAVVREHGRPSIAEPHILLTVVQPTDFGKPAFSAAWRAGRLALSRGQHAAHDAPCRRPRV
jgi:hypothetical protein